MSTVEGQYSRTPVIRLYEPLLDRVSTLARPLCKLFSIFIYENITRFYDDPRPPTLLFEILSVTLGVRIIGFLLYTALRPATRPVMNLCGSLALFRVYNRFM